MKIYIEVKDTSIVSIVDKDDFNKHFIDSCKLKSCYWEQPDDIVQIYEMQLYEYAFAIQKLKESIENA